MKTPKIVIVFLLYLVSINLAAQNDKPLRLGIVGLSHAHVHEVLVRLNRGDFEIVGVAEKDTSLWNRKDERQQISRSLYYRDLDEMLDKCRPEAVIVYESIYDHLRVVESCAPRGIHVMVEKPLAVSTEHANRMAALARKNDIQLLTNYETSWYPSNHEAYDLINNKKLIGNISRINVYDGHKGPIEIGCGKEFTDWLTDPKLNGGGAVIDFGCYGANLATWLMNGQKPLSVFAELKQLKPNIYPKVDDDATIVIEYPASTVIILASWNWPMNRKDMHIYGKNGYIYQDNQQDLRIYESDKETRKQVENLPKPYNDAFYYLKAVVRNEIEVKPADLSALENNLIVVEILEKAIQSAQKGEKIRFSR